jgi:CHASE3 domain sensor protein
MAKEKRDILVLALIVVVILLLGFISYMFVIQPAINAQVVGWANKGYNQAQVDMINSMLLQLQQNGYVLLPTGNGNQTIALVVYQPQQ